MFAGPALAFYLFLLTAGSNLFVDAEDDPCTAPLVRGEKCAGTKPSMKYHFDKTLHMCFPFMDEGCGSGINSFDTEEDCHARCSPADHFTCGGNTEPQGICSPLETCKNGTTCVMGSGMGFCCDKKIQDEWNAEGSPTCKTGKVVKIDFWYGPGILLGNKCEHNFCPKGSKCIEGTWRAHCCQ